MKRFFISVLFVSVFCIGLGALIDAAGAKGKSDERALDLIRKARQAIGGDSNLVAVRSLSIAGQPGSGGRPSPSAGTRPCADEFRRAPRSGARPGGIRPR